MKHLSHKIRIYPNNQAKTYFAKAFGISRFAYNWGLDQCTNAYKNGEKHPSGYDLSKRLNAIKKEQYPWMYEVSKWSPQKALYNLSDAFKSFFKKKSKYPRFKKRGVSRESFYLGVNSFKVNGNHLYIPSLGWIRMSQELRFPYKQLSVVISRTSMNKYYASIQVQLDDFYVYSHACESQASVGIDVGVKDLVVLSDGTKFKNPKVLKFFLSKLKRLHRLLSRKRKGSNNRKKAIQRLSRCYERIRNLRSNLLHKITSFIVKNFKTIGIEDLNVKGMMQNHKLAQSIQDASFSEIRRQLEYKAKLSSSDVIPIHRFYPSSKTCHVCGQKNEKLQLKDRKWICDFCGTVHDRDINAAKNLKQLAVGYTERINACGGSRDLKKQEGGILC